MSDKSVDSTYWGLKAQYNSKMAIDAGMQMENISHYVADRG